MKVVAKTESRAVQPDFGNRQMPIWSARMDVFGRSLRFSAGHIPLAGRKRALAARAKSRGDEMKERNVTKPLRLREL